LSTRLNGCGYCFLLVETNSVAVVEKSLYGKNIGD